MFVRTHPKSHLSFNFQAYGRLFKAVTPISGFPSFRIHPHQTPEHTSRVVTCAGRTYRFPASPPRGKKLANGSYTTLNANAG